MEVDSIEYMSLIEKMKRCLHLNNSNLKFIQKLRTKNTEKFRVSLVLTGQGKKG